MMKPRMIIGLFLLTSLAGCISSQQTHLLVTPIGAAGIHSFAPRQQPPDQMAVQAKRIEKSMDRMTAEDAQP